MKKPIESSQHARFLKAASELGADDDEATFKAKLVLIARQKVKKDEMEPPREQDND